MTCGHFSRHQFTSTFINFPYIFNCEFGHFSNQGTPKSFLYLKMLIPLHFVLCPPNLTNLCCQRFQSYLIRFELLLPKYFMCAKYVKQENRVVTKKTLMYLHTV